MTEKRFVNKGKDILQYGEWWCSANGEHCADVIATAINELIEENEQLKKDCKSYEWYKQYKELLNKNEQLKSDIEYIKQLIKDRIKHYHSYSCIRLSPNEHKGCIGLKMELEKIYDDIDW